MWNNETTIEHNNVGLQAPLGWKVVQFLSARTIAREYEKVLNFLLSSLSSCKRYTRVYKIVWAGLFKAGLERNLNSIMKAWKENSSLILVIWRKIIAVIHQSLFQLLPVPPVYCVHLPAISVPGMGHLQILHCPGAGHLPTPGRAFDTHAVRHQNQACRVGGCKGCVRTPTPHRCQRSTFYWSAT